MTGLMGDKIYLSPEIDFDIAKTNRNLYAVRRWCRQYKPINESDQMKWKEKIESDPTIQMYSIRNLDLEQVGVCGFTSIDRHNRSAEFSLYINPDEHRNGYAFDALKVLVKHGFLDWGFHRLWGEVFRDNPAMELFKKCGFGFFGIARESYFREGKFIDSFFIELLESDPEWK